MSSSTQSLPLPAAGRQHLRAVRTGDVPPVPDFLRPARPGCPPPAT